MKKKQSLLDQFKKNNKQFQPQTGKYDKKFGMQGKIAAMQNIQRASGRRGN